MKKLTTSFAILIVLLVLIFPTTAFAAPESSKIPTFTITGVVRDTSVTIYTNNFPANDTFVVLMNKIGTRGVNGIRVTSINSGKGGAFSATFTIPNALKGLKQIAIRLESTTGSGYYSYNWFYNSTSGKSNGTPGGSKGTGYKGIPTFTINAVVRNTSVTIYTNNFPAKQTFKVLMNTMGTRGINGIQVDTIQSGNGGSFYATFAIPAALKGQKQIAIRLQSTTGSGYYAYNWFYNNTTK
jgi:hypothetical protein